MARQRIRTIKPEMWTSAQVLRLSDSAVLMFCSLLNQADDEGRLVYDTLSIEAKCPRFYGKSKKLIEELAKQKLIEIYDALHHQLIQIVKFTEHQNINRPRPSDYPAPPSMQRGGRPRGSKSKDEAFMVDEMADIWNKHKHKKLDAAAASEHMPKRTEIMAARIRNNKWLYKNFEHIVIAAMHKYGSMITKGKARFLDFGWFATGPLIKIEGLHKMQLPKNAAAKKTPRL